MRQILKKSISPLCTQTCYCTKPEIVFLPFENETVCKRCGVVLENQEITFQDIENTIPYEMLCKTNLNLHQRKQIGGDPNAEQIVTLSKFHTHESDQNLLVGNIFTTILYLQTQYEIIANSFV